MGDTGPRVLSDIVGLVHVTGGSLGTRQRVWGDSAFFFSTYSMLSVCVCVCHLCIWMDWLYFFCGLRFLFNVLCLVSLSHLFLFIILLLLLFSCFPSLHFLCIYQIYVTFYFSYMFPQNEDKETKEIKQRMINR